MVAGTGFAADVPEHYGLIEFRPESDLRGARALSP